MVFVVATTDGITEVHTRQYRAKTRLGAFAHDTGRLLSELRDRNGRPLATMSERDFARRWSRRVRLVIDEATGRTFELEADPRRVKALWAMESVSSEDLVRGKTP